MRLLNAKTFELESVPVSPPPYAILSHTWGSDEVLFEDIQNKTACRKQSFSKVEGCCKIAVSEGYDYIWIDTCCIDKSSSAELSEAINSMFNWYRDSGVAYAYLEDYSDSPLSRLTTLNTCRWFSRGWTLQELIAPRKLIIFDKHWKELGTRHDLSMRISELTGISQWILSDGGGEITEKLRLVSLYQRFSWAARRKTTRPEDMAYSLLGIFDVNLPPLYGEGSQKAFFRLQEEVMRNTMDQTILAWGEDIGNGNGMRTKPVLAESPKLFGRMGALVPFLPDRATPYHMTNKGLSITLRLILASELMGDPSWVKLSEGLAIGGLRLSPNSVIGILDCHFTQWPLLFVGIPLVPIDSGADPLTAETFARCDEGPIPVWNSMANRAAPRDIYISRSRSCRIGDGNEATFMVQSIRSPARGWKGGRLFYVSVRPRALAEEEGTPGACIVVTRQAKGEAARGVIHLDVSITLSDILRKHHQHLEKALVLSFRAGGTGTPRAGVALLDPEEVEEASWLIADQAEHVSDTAMKIFPCDAVLLAEIKPANVANRAVHEVSVYAVDRELLPNTATADDIRAVATEVYDE